MRSLFLWILVILFFTSCQSTPEPPQVEKELETPTPIEADPVPVTIREKKDQPPRKKMSMELPRNPKPIPKPVVESYPPSTISKCPAGLNGTLVGPIEKGRYCFTNTPETPKKCLDKNNDEVRKKAEAYCSQLKGHWERKGMWSYGPEFGLKVEKLKRYNCQCGSWRGQPLCKAFFEFDCETIKK